MFKKITVFSIILILFLTVSSASAIDADLSDSLEDVSSSNLDIASSDLTGSDSASLSSSILSDSSEDVSSSSDSLSRSDDSNLSADSNELTSNDAASSDSTDSAEDSSYKVLQETALKSDSISFNYASPKALAISLTDSSGLALSNKTVSVSIAGEIYNLTTDSKGTAVLDFRSSVGVYDASISFYGDEDYAPSNASSRITIKKSSSKIKMSNVRGYLTISNYISATLVDSAGNAVSGKTVTFLVNKTKYTAKTNNKGVAKVKLANKVGTYVIKAKFSADENYSSSSNSSKLVISKMKVYIKAPSVKSYMTKNTYLTINLTNVKGNALKNKKVYVKIAKKTYTLTTDSSGIAKLKFAKKVGTSNCKITFKATGSYYAATSSSKVVISKVPTSIKAPSVSVNSTSYGKILITLKDGFGKPLKNTVLSVNVTGLNKVYKVKTNGSGIVVFKFNGEKTFALKIKYAGNKNYAASSASSKLTIKPIKIKLKDIIGASGLLSSYVAENKSLPDYISYKSNNFTVAQLSYLMAKAVKNIDAKNYNDIVLISVLKSYKTSGEIYDTVYKASYVSIAKSVVLGSYNYKNKEYVKYSIYKVPFKVYTLNFAKILNYYGNNKKLPNYSLFTGADFVKVSNSSKYTFYLTTDNIAGKKSDLNMLKSLAKTLRNKGYNAVIVGIGPDIHNIAYRYGCTGDKSVLLACFGGVDVGCIEEWTGDIGELNGHHFTQNYDGAHVLGLWFTKPYGASVSLYKKVGMAWDADYGFALSNPAKYMSSHNISYIQTGTVANACKLLSQGKMGGPKLIK